ncbi:MAG: response regulator [Patescibacteria group bacterium]
MTNNKNNKIKLLIIEDEEALADVLVAKFKKVGYDVSLAYNGEAGYKKIIEFKPNLIILDIVMPKMNGYEVLEKMRDEKIDTPVIIISNSGQPVEIEKTKKLGAVDHLIKTQFDPAEVLEKVNKYLNGKNSKSVAEEIKPIEDNTVKKKLNIKVLIIEDDSFLREICAKKLTKEGFIVYEAIDGEQALGEINKIKPDIILLDIILPAIDGFEVLEKIRANKDKKIKQIPIIMLSNLGQEDDIEKALGLGANNYLVKAHFTTDEIVEKIKKEINIK